MEELKMNNANGLDGLRGDLKEMKKVINKLSSEDWYNKKEELIPKEEFESKIFALCQQNDELKRHVEAQKGQIAQLEEVNTQTE